ncbi:spermidine synthase [Actinokineospora iranica]|uniref:spermidine synthase n=1 Tax=Actinokineospora iranica TaxID=1271860 RepID=UPI0011143D95|nr:fused MFS/spermidine synthase [Actinokineospora iranica]
MRFGTAEVLRDIDRANGWLLSVDGVAQSYLDLDDPTHLEFDYVRRIADVVDCLGRAGAALAAVHVGGGACTLARYIAATRPGARQVVVDADAALVALVRAQFGLDVPGVDVRVGDGRAEVAAMPDASVDLVVLDAFERGLLAGGLVTIEATRDMSRVLRADGVYLVNLSDGPGLPFARRVVATLCAVFGEVLLIAEPGVLRGRRFGNIVLAAAAADLPVAAVAARAAAAAFPSRCLTSPELRARFGPARPLTDAEAVAAPLPPKDPFARPEDPTGEPD